jgi:ankyrin repeat protein
MSMASMLSTRRRLLRVLAASAALAFSPALARAAAFDDFFKAIRFDDAKSVRSLLQRGMDANIVEEERGESAVMVALREDAMKSFQLLIDSPGFDPELPARNGDTALMLAAYKGNLDAVQALLAKGAQVNRPGWTALHYAAAAGKDDIVRLLLEQSAYIDAESPNRTTPIMMAARSGHIMTVKVLLDEGADATLKNDAGMSAIDFAKAGEFNDIAEGLAYRLRKAGK